MNIVVLVKYVPDRSGKPPEIGPDFRLRRETGDGGLDPADELGLATARELADETDGSVCAVSMGPERAVIALQRALAIGADRAILVTDDAVSGADALATARVLAAAITRVPYELVIAAVESSDACTGTMPMALAELLGIPCATFARRIVLDSGGIVTERLTDDGYDVIECALPALVTVTAGVAEPVYPSVRQMLQAKRMPVERLSLVDLGVDPALALATQQVTAIELELERQTGELLDDLDEAPARIVQALREAQVV